MSAIDALQSLLALTKFEFKGRAPPEPWSRVIAKAEAVLASHQDGAEPVADNIVELGPHSKMSPDEALAYSAREDWEDVIIVGYHGNGDFVVRSSHMSRESSLWLAEHLKMHVLDLQAAP